MQKIYWHLEKPKKILVLEEPLPNEKLKKEMKRLNQSMQRTSNWAQQIEKSKYNLNIIYKFASHHLNITRNEK